MKSLRSRLLLYFLILGFLSALASGGIQVWRFYRYMLLSIEEDLNRTVQSVVDSLDHEVILRSTDPAVVFEPGFIHNATVMRAVKKAMALTYFYTLVPNQEGQFVFAIDANDTFEWDGEKNDTTEPNVQGTVYEEVPDKMREAWESGELRFQDTFYTDKWGTYLSSFLPVKDASGRPIYLIGADYDVTSVFARLNESLLSFLIALGGALLISVFFAWGVSRSVTRSIVALTEVARELARKNFSVEIRLPRIKDEIYQLAQAYQTMAAEIDRYTTHLEEVVSQRTAELREANAQLVQRQEEMERDLRLARRIQQNILPNEKTYPNREEMEFGTVYQSMVEVGGDFFDIVRCGRNQYGILIADVSGHGVPAALVTTMAKVSFNSNSGYNVLPGEVCQRVNADLVRMLGGDFSHYLTAFYGLLDLELNRFYYTNAGHHSPVLIRANGELFRLGKPHFFLGMTESVDFDTESIELQPGDTVVMYTDGIPEAMNPEQELYDEDRLLEYLKRHARLPAKALVEGLMRDVEAFCRGQPATDDKAVLLMRFLGERKIELESSVQTSQQRDEVYDRLKRALALAREKRWAEAETILEELYRRVPENVKVVNNYAVVLCKTGKASRARDLLQAALKGHPGNQDLVSSLRHVEKLLRGEEA